MLARLVMMRCLLDVLTLSLMTKRGSSSGYESSHTYRERVSIGDFFVKGSVHFFFRDVVRI